MSCPDHPRYQGKRKPRVTCIACWDIWFWSKHNKMWAHKRVVNMLKARDAIAMRDRQSGLSQQPI